ncbi:hypothetical protein LCGC14_0552400 [marine sediment metagenome]|uniref:PD-(D/E)XK endonuclease-like domain-containing protein n=1 Tax=marine sediment metagenome TaxID=412755 RepID=A0A0F9S856_9ZZZZ
MSTPEGSDLHQFFTETLSKYLSVVQAPRPNKDEWWASESDYCFRKRVLRRAGTPQLPVPLNSMMTREHGKMIEKIVGKAFQAHDVVRQGEIYLPEFKLRGHFDFLIFRDDETVICVDAKSANGQSFGFLTRRGSEGYRMQNALYAHGIETNGYTLTAPGSVGDDKTDECVTQREPVKVDKVAIFVIDKEYGNPHTDEYDKELYIKKAITDLREADKHWAQYQDNGTLPPETPMIAARSDNKHVKARRCAAGEMAPAGLCSPAYCGVIHACPRIAAWWKTHGKFNLTLPKAAAKETQNG